MAVRLEGETMRQLDRIEASVPGSVTFKIERKTTTNKLGLSLTPLN